MTEWLAQPWVARVLATAALLAVAAALRVVVGRRIRGHAVILDEDQRRQLSYLRSSLSALVLIGLLVIWLSQLENAVLSLTAVAVAVAIATKELLMCVSGFLMRASGRLFSIGDWIECDRQAGEVTHFSMLSTTLLEVETAANGYAYTGRILTLPNSLFVTHPVRTAPRARRYVLHRFRIVLESPVAAEAARTWLAERAAALSEPFRDEARRYNEQLDRELGVDVPGPDPSVGVQTSDIGKQQYVVTLYCPTPSAGELEHRLTAEFLEAVQAGSFASGPGQGGPASAP